LLHTLGKPEGRRSATRFAYLEILPNCRAATAASFLQRFLERFPLALHTVLTDSPIGVPLDQLRASPAVGFVARAA
jgi:hypothetical protein